MLVLGRPAKPTSQNIDNQSSTTEWPWEGQKSSSSLLLGLAIGVETSRAAREKLGIGSVKSSNEPSLNELDPELEPKLQLVY